MMLGLEKGKVVVAEYSDEWPKRFEAARAELQQLFDKAGLAVSIEHIGSTAVPHLPAKPIIDIAIGFQRSLDVGRGLSVLLSHGYEYVKAANQPGMLFVAFGSPRTLHAHLVLQHTHAWSKLIVFRDHLRRHPGLAAQYGERKAALARRYPSSRLEYAAGKRQMLQAILHRAFNESRMRRHAAVKRRQLADRELKIEA
jgi:GrpB-like predicted nucleotidyltransferase (UPF0157 family)